ncbi:MAG: signal peptidase I [Clostridia bacterium]|nr:signal peptidase I [Clostridia bacterium]
MQEDIFGTTEKTTDLSSPQAKVSRDDILHELEDTLDHILHDFPPEPEQASAEPEEPAEETDAEPAEEPVAEPAEEPVAEPAEESTSEPARTPDETPFMAPEVQVKAAEEVLQEPAETAEEQVSAEPAEDEEQALQEPAEITDEQPSQEPAEAPFAAPVQQITAAEEMPAEPAEAIDEQPAEAAEAQTPDQPAEPLEGQHAEAAEEMPAEAAEEQAPEEPDATPEELTRITETDAGQVPAAEAETGAAAERAWDPFAETLPQEAAAEAAPAGKAKKKVKPGTVVLDIVLAVIVVIVVFIVAFAVCFEGVYIVGTSMMPTFTGALDSETEGGDYVYANKYRKPTYGDVVIIQETESKIIIKRVIAMEGDSVYMDQGTVYVQYAGTAEYTALEEDYVAAENNTPALNINTQKAHTVADGCIYCLGDNRDVSNDSRQNGDFPLDSVLGVVPNWIISIKSFTTSLYDLIHF